MFSSCPFSLLYVCTSTTSLPQETSQQKALKVLFWSFGCFLMLLTACSPLAKQTPYSLDVPVEVRSPPRAAAVPRCGVSTLHRVLFLNAPVPGNSVCLHARPPVCFCLSVCLCLLSFCCYCLDSLCLPTLFLSIVRSFNRRPFRCLRHCLARCQVVGGFPDQRSTLSFAPSPPLVFYASLFGVL